MFHPEFIRFINDEVLPLTSLDVTAFWEGFDNLIHEFSDDTRALLAHRLELQAKINGWHEANPSFSQADYEQFLRSVGYLLPPIDDFSINTKNVDSEIATLAGPQLVVPLKNARFALNAANARWGSLYDALYGSDVIADDPAHPRKPGYDPVRGEKVIAHARMFLDSAVPLESASHADATSYRVGDGLIIELTDGHQTRLRDATQFVGYLGDAGSPSSVLFKHHGLHIECVINREGSIGRDDVAGINDINLEAALTTIMDCEDSVAAVDAEDKIDVYRNWLGLMTNTLSANFVKGGTTLTRKLNKNREFLDPTGKPMILRGRSLLFNRNVGLLMTSELAQDNTGQQVPEHIIDALVTALVSMIDLRSNSDYGNSRTGSIYIVKPKLHGPAEVAFTCQLFTRIETLLSLPPNTIKLGIMDEERRTSANLRHCIFEARERLVFINTGFLDRTGDEIYTSMNAGVFPPKSEIKDREWIRAYENRNVEIGLACGLQGRAQIGKGMWAMPDEMAAMMRAKIVHPQSGASTAWVPSPTAAVLHAMHYHAVDVKAAQESVRLRAPSTLSALLTIPLLDQESPLDEESIARELENNIQGILGYVVRWVEHGIGCSKVPDIQNIGLMEDRATLRISSVHISNWLKHGLCSAEQVIAVMQRMAKVVDEQNASDPLYNPMASDFEKSAGFAAAKALIFENPMLPNGYTEPLLHSHRIMFKAMQP
jgi:malate synthase